MKTQSNHTVRRAVNLNLNRAPVLLATLAFLSFAGHAISGEGTEQKTADILAVALKKSNAKKTYQFKKHEIWSGPLFMGIAGVESSTKGTYVHPHVRYQEEDQGKFIRQSYWVDGVLCTRMEYSSNRVGEWKTTPAKSTIGTLITYPFDLSDSKSFTVKAAGKEKAHSYMVIAKGAHTRTAANEILKREHSLTLENVKGLPTVYWIVVLDPATHLIQTIEENLQIGQKTVPVVKPALTAPPANTRDGRNKLFNDIDRAGTSFRLTTVHFTYGDKIKVNIPNELQKLLEQQRDDK